MTLKSFLIIIHQTSRIMYMRDYWKPDAVCMSRKIFNDLVSDAREAVLVYAPQSEANSGLTDAQICGLAVFIDDSMPNEYYHIGYKDQFIKYFATRKKK